MSKQDRQGARTPADLERKYNFGQSFAEAMGIATDAKENADNAKATAAEALSAANALDEGLDQTEIFNRLTNGGEEQGFYLQNGKVYLNASYVKSGVLSGDMIDGKTLNIIEGATIAGWGIDNNSIFKKPEGGTWGQGTFMCTGSNTSFDIGGSGVKNGWVFGAGGKFGVTSIGDVYCSSLNANDGCRLGKWYVSSGSISSKFIDKEGTVDTVSLDTTGLAFIYNQDGNNVIFAPWDKIIKAVNDYADLEARVAALEQKGDG